MTVTGWWLLRWLIDSSLGAPESAREGETATATSRDGTPFALPDSENLELADMSGGRRNGDGHDRAGAAGRADSPPDISLFEHLTQTAPPPANAQHQAGAARDVHSAAVPAREPVVDPLPLPFVAPPPAREEQVPAEAPAARPGVSVWLPALSLVAACGLAVIVVADTLARSGRARPDALYWLGLLLIVVPIAMRLLARDVNRIERIGLLLVVTLELYLIKVAWAPFGFTMPDEFAHWFNVDEIVATKHLFFENPLLGVTSRYPGMETVTAAIVSMTGLKTFYAGLIVVGVAKLLLMLALYLFFEEITRSSRIAGFGALLYTAQGNFLFFNSAFKYESLALPLVIVAVLAVTKWQKNVAPPHRVLWGTIGASAIVCTTMTHHVSSYLLFVYLLAASLVHLRLKQPLRSSPVPFALLSAGATVAWLLFAAGETTTYIGEIFGHAATGFVDTLSSGSGRAPLSSDEGAPTTPMWEHVALFGFVLLVTAALPFALRRTWRTYRRNVPVLLLALAAVGYLSSFALRLSPAAWETGNRSSEFLFIGAALMLAFVAADVIARSSSRGRPLVLLGLATMLIFVGSNIGGQPRDVRLPLTLHLRAGDHVLEPAAYAFADWTRANLGEGRPIIADETNRRLLAVTGASSLSYNSGRGWGASFLLRNESFYKASFWVMRTYPARYAVADRLRSSWDNVRGYYFPSRARKRDDLVRPLNGLKFERLRGVQRLADTGDIVLYDVGEQRAAG